MNVNNEMHKIQGSSKSKTSVRFLIYERDLKEIKKMAIEHEFDKNGKIDAEAMGNALSHILKQNSATSCLEK